MAANNEEFSKERLLITEFYDTDIALKRLKLQFKKITENCARVSETVSQSKLAH